MKALLILAACLMVSCAHQEKPTSIPKAVVVSPSVGQIAPKIKKATEENVKLKAQVDVLEEKATRAHNEATKATEEAKKLAIAGSATKTQLETLYASMKAVTERNESLVSEITNAKQTILKQKDYLDDSWEATQLALQKASASDQVAKQLEINNHQLTQERDKALDGFDKVNGKLIAQRQFSRYSIGLNLLLLLVIGGYIAIKIYKPL